MAKRRIVITGLGMVTPVGNDVKTAWESILAGKSGVGPITKFDASPLATRIAAEVKNFDPAQYFDLKECRKSDQFLQFGVAAAIQAIEDSKITSTNYDKNTIGVAIGSGMGGLSLIEKNHLTVIQSGMDRISPNFIPNAIIDMAPAVVAMKYGFKGPNISVVTACATGAHNIGIAARLIAYGDADVMIAGGAEMSTTPLGVGGFAAARALSRRNDEPEKASRPWDKDRDGFVLGEGAGALVLEEYEHAIKRNATIYAELVGFGMSDDAYHKTAPDPEATGAVLSIQTALRDAGLSPADISYINAHGTSTGPGDIMEALAIKKAFQENAYKVAISSTKSMTGHLLGATGAVESIFSILAIRDQIAPPTINLDNPDEGCDLDFVPHKARKMPINTVMKNSFGFGGTNVTLIFKKI